MVDGFVWFRMVRQGARWVALCIFALVWFVRFVRVRPGCLWVRLGSSGSSGCTLGVAGFVRILLDRPGVPWGSLGSLGYVRVRPCGRWVNFCSFGTYEYALVVAG